MLGYNFILNVFQLFILFFIYIVWNKVAFILSSVLFFQDFNPDFNNIKVKT